MRGFGIFIIAFMLMSQYPVGGWRTSLEEDTELERELKVLNKPAIKTFQTPEGEIIDCIDIYKQPSLDHPLLKNHKVQMRPASSPKEFSTKFSSEVKSSKPLLRGSWRCPEGTVPIQRTRKEDLRRAKYFSKTYGAFHKTDDFRSPNQHIAAFYSHDGPYHGTGAYIDLYNVNVAADQYSISLIWVQNDSIDQRNLIQTGWMIAPEVYGDNATRTFTYWTADNTRTGCFNILCPGFIQVDRETILGEKVYKLSKFNTTEQYVINPTIFQDENTGNWWLLYDNNKHIGYWPKSLLPGLVGGASLVGWGGSTIGPPNGDSPPMGNGHFPMGDYTTACYIHKLRVFDASYQISEPTNLVTSADNTKCYDVEYSDFGEDLGHFIFFGGPGGKC